MAGGVKGFMDFLFKAPDPYKQQRESIRNIIRDIQMEFPEIEQAIRTQGATQFGGMARRLEDVGAAGGAPREQTAQRLISAGLGTQRNVMGTLGDVKMQKARILQNIAGIIGSLPPPPADTTGQQIFGTIGQGLGMLPGMIGQQGQSGGTPGGNQGVMNQLMAGTHPTQANLLAPAGGQQPAGNQMLPFGMSNIQAQSMDFLKYLQPLGIGI